ncbi:MAG: tryptophan--tRNA ligase, partial [bacterium]
LQEQGDAYLFIADYHALTSVSDPSALRQNSRDVALDFLACGLDTKRTVFFRQSDVPEVLELSWLLSIVTPMGLLERCHSYKDKTAKGIAASHALFSYPVLMAADILQVQATTVPVGRDQKQHVEVTRDIAIKFNLQFGETFAIPVPAIRDEVAVVPGVDGQKMSKSYNNTIEIFGPEKDTKSRIMKIVTDSKQLEDSKDPSTCNVFALYKLFASGEERQEMEAKYRAGGYGYGTAKKALFEKVWNYFEPYRARRVELEKDPAHVEAVLKDGANRARLEARKTLTRARQAVGLE